MKTTHDIRQRLRDHWSQRLTFGGGEVVDVVDDIEELLRGNSPSNWLNTGHSREFWLAEYAGRAMQGSFAAFVTAFADHVAKVVDGEAKANKNNCPSYIADWSVALAEKMVGQLESDLKGAANA